jgi:hypothetical protein
MRCFHLIALQNDAKILARSVAAVAAFVYVHVYMLDKRQEATIKLTAEVTCAG